MIGLRLIKIILTKKKKNDIANDKETIKVNEQAVSEAQTKVEQAQNALQEKQAAPS